MTSREDTTKPNVGHDADRVFTNARIHTQDSTRSVAQAVAVHAERIVYVGTDSGVASFIGPRTEVVDLDGKMVLPGFIDSHMHLMLGAVEALYEVSIPYGLPVAEYLPRIKAFADDNPGLPVIRGAGWDDGAFLLAGPAKEMLDTAVPDRPAAIVATSRHTLWVNTAALQLAGITKDTPDPPHGTIEKDAASGEPTGTLYESAQDLVLDKLPPYSVDQYKAGFEYILRSVAGKNGITSAFEARILPREANGRQALEELEREGKLTLRIRAALMLDPDRPLDSQLRWAEATRKQHDGPLFKTDAVKFFVDGVGFTTYLLEPFSTIPAGLPADCRGVSTWTAEGLSQASVAAAQRGFRLHYHAIGDAAVRMSLDAVAKVEEAVGSTEVRPEIAHLFVVDPTDMQRLADLKVVAVLQPVWMMKDPVYDSTYLPLFGDERCERLFPLKSLFDLGLTVASSSDYPVTDPDSPLDGIMTGVLRWHPSWSEPGDVWTPAERVGLGQMIDSFTINGAKANFLEHETGSIEVGKSADMVVLNEDLFDLPPERIGYNWLGLAGTAKVLMTIFAGKTVYADPESHPGGEV